MKKRPLITMEKIRDFARIKEKARQDSKSTDDGNDAVIAAVFPPAVVASSSESSGVV